MKIGFLFILITSFIFASLKYSNKKVYDEIKGSIYHPIFQGKKYNYIADGTHYSMNYDSIPTERQGKKYIKITIEYGNSNSVGYYREDNGTVIYIKPEQAKETVEIPSNPKIGMVWYESDSTWKYTVTSLTDTLETPTDKFINCLVIKSENIAQKINSNYDNLYMQYYQRGRGYVGTKINGLTYSYLIVE